MEACIITNRQQWNDFVASSDCCNITQSYEWGELSSYLGAKDVLRVTAKPKKSASFNERLMYKVDAKGFALLWENLEVPVSIK